MGAVLTAIVDLLKSRLVGSCAVLLCVAYVIGAQKRWSRRRELKEVAKRKRAQRDELRAQAKKQGLDWESAKGWAAKNAAGCAPPSAVVDMTASELLDSMAKGALSAEYVMRCFVGRAMALGEALGTNAEECFAEAVEEAAACDRERSAGKLRGRLHGLPISMKDQFHQKGYDATCGFAARCFKPFKQDGLLVSLLREQGAIPFCRTNLPQALLSSESANDIWGHACNPFDPTRTVGGSTGGEAALLVARGTPIGLASDIAGSARIPATFCGAVGFKPTYGRLSNDGLGIARLNDIDGQNAVKASPGLMGRCVADCALVMDSWLQPRMFESDNGIPNMPWNPKLVEATKGAKKMKFGYYTSDGYFEPAPACARAVLDTVEALRRAGHEVVEFPPTEMYEAALMLIGVLMAEGKLAGIINACEGEALNPIHTYLYKIAHVPSAVRSLLVPILRYLKKDKRTADILEASGAKSARDFWKFVGRRDQLRKQLLKRWHEAGIDALITPGLAVPAFPHGMSNVPGSLNQACSYTFVWNNFNFPAGVLPVSTVKPEEEEYVATLFHDNYSKVAAKACKGSAGLPVGVHVVTTPWKDEQCVGAMHVVEKAVGFKLPVPGSAPPM